MCMHVVIPIKKSQIDMHSFFLEAVWWLKGGLLDRKVSSSGSALGILFPKEECLHKLYIIDYERTK